MITVAKDGSGDFSSVQAAINSVPKENTEPITIFVNSVLIQSCLLLIGPILHWRERK